MIKFLSGSKLGENLLLVKIFMNTVVQKYMSVLLTSTVFAQSDAAATIYFVARVCAAFIQEWRLFESVVYYYQQLPERQSLEKRSIDTTDLGDSDPFADVGICSRRLLNVYRVPAIENESRSMSTCCLLLEQQAWRRYYLRAATISFSTSGGAATIQEQRLIESGV